MSELKHAWLWTDAMVRYSKCKSAKICVRCHGVKALPDMVHCERCRLRNVQRRRAFLKKQAAA